MRTLLLLCLCLTCCTGDDASNAATELSTALEDIRARYALASISVAQIADGEAIRTVVGDAQVDTIYSLASCSKPVVGLAAARLFELRPDLDLDTDVAEVIDWDLAHPDHPDAPITFRHLLTHTGGLVADSAADYETYPKPDPDQPLGPWLEGLLADDALWLSTAPGAEEAYSNLGVALLAHAIEVAADQDFRAFTREHIFDPLRLDDTRWFYADLSTGQQARHAVPFDSDGEPYEIYGFNDYPSGLLRSTSGDVAQLLIALADGGGEILSRDAMEAFEGTPMLVEAYAEGGAQRFEHSGGEAGVTTYFTWRSDGRGYVYLINSDVDDEETLEALHAELDALLLRED